MLLMRFESAMSLSITSHAWRLDSPNRSWKESQRERERGRETERVRERERKRERERERERERREGMTEQ